MVASTLNFILHVFNQNHKLGNLFVTCLPIVSQRCLCCDDWLDFWLEVLHACYVYPAWFTNVHSIFLLLDLQPPVFLLALLRAVLEVNVGWGTASVIRDVSDWITAATTLLSCHASQVHNFPLCIYPLWVINISSAMIVVYWPWSAKGSTVKPVRWMHTITNRWMQEGLYKVVVIMNTCLLCRFCAKYKLFFW